MVFVGPDASAMRVLADGVTSGRLAASAGVEVSSGNGAATADVAGAADRLTSPSRRIEVQVVADGQGGVWVLGVRDCAYQRDHELVLAESASPALTAEQERDLAQAARRLMLEAGYRNVGTVEFVLDAESGRFLPEGLPRACRWPIRSPRRSRASTSSSCSCTSRRVAGSSAIRRRSSVTRSGRASAPRTRRSASPRRLAGSRSCACRPVPGFASTSAPPKATRSRPSSTR